MGLLGKRPDATEVAHRILSLSTILGRGREELSMMEERDPILREKKRHEVDIQSTRMFADKTFARRFSPRERALLSAPAGKWTRQDIANASWRAESVGILLWAVGLIKSIPPYDKEFEQPEVIQRLDMLYASPDYVRRLALRSAQEIGKAREIAEHWHWRSRTTQIQREGVQAPPGITFDRIIEVSAIGGYEDGMNPAPIENDFPAFGKPYRSLTEAEYSLASSIAMERHFALNWLCGFSKDWDDTPTDT